MKIFIITMDDPVYTIGFIKKVIDSRKDDIVGLAISKGERLTIQKKRSKIAYIFSLLLIMGGYHFFKNSWITVFFKIRKKVSKIIPIIKNPSISEYAKSQGIDTWEIKTPNSNRFRKILKEKQVDVIINQSQSILKKKLLDLSKLGVINRHNSLLPKNRGRLTPFWVLFKGEKETGVSIHFVNNGIDAGYIIVQEKFPVLKNYNFNSLVKKNYEVAPIAMLKALDILEKENYKLIENDDVKSTYNTIPTFKQALKYRIKRIFNRR